MFDVGGHTGTRREAHDTNEACDVEGRGRCSLSPWLRLKLKTPPNSAVISL